MVDTTWTNGGGDGLASNPANWSNGIDVGYNVTFNGTSTANCTFDYDGELGSFTIAAGYTGTITQSSDIHITGYTQGAGTFTGVATKWVYCSGNLTQTAGTITNYVPKFNFTGESVTVRITGWLKEIVCNDAYFYGTNFSVDVLTVNDGHVMAIESARTIAVKYYAGSTFNNRGVINGGTVQFDLYNSDMSINFGDIRSNVIISSIAAQTANRKLTVLNDVVWNSLEIKSAHATRTCTLELNGRSLAANTTVVGVRGIIINSAGTKTVVRCSAFDSSAGTFTPDRTVLVMEGASTIKLAAGGTVNSLISKGATTLASDVTISDVCAHVNPITKGAFALTLTKPENEYTGLRRPITQPIVALNIGSVGLANGWLKDMGGIV